MSFLKIASLTCIALTLGACQSLFQPATQKPLEFKRDAWEQVKPGCNDPDCPLVNIDTVHFPSEPQLDSLIEHRLLQMTQATPLPTSLKAYQDQFLATSASRQGSYLQAKVLEQHDGLVIIELISYLDNGTPQGTPSRSFINWSREEHKALTLQDILLPGQEEAFWKLVKVAHNSWQINNRVDQDFVRTWPFQTTPNVALTSDGVLLKYNVTTIAPYAMGLIDLKVDYSRLNGILKPERFPARQ
ncbi:RsiV family protein [Pseudomonas asplenii]|uniref:RsiV family protein n=1 Tax=Pseudomonas asplenii TaxID=53407 RepID=UPI002361B7C6|nr:RsiV family protein [Pseudomonas asplenii]